MINFLNSLNKALEEESNLFISYKKEKDGLIIKVFDFKNRGINKVKVYLNNDFLGFTNDQGVLKINKKVPKKSVLRAELGIYFSKKGIMP